MSVYTFSAQNIHYTDIFSRKFTKKCINGQFINLSIERKKLLNFKEKFYIENKKILLFFKIKIIKIFVAHKPHPSSENYHKLLNFLEFWLNINKVTKANIK